MARMLELMRQAAVPAHIMRTASRGALALPAAEMLEILVFLAHSPFFGEEARLTLAGWDPMSARQVLSHPHAPREVLAYFAAPPNRRPDLLPTLLENSAVRDSEVLDIAEGKLRGPIEMLLASARVRHSRSLLLALAENPNLTDAEAALVQRWISNLSEALPEDDIETLIARYQTEHADEIAAEEGRPFQLAEPEDHAAEFSSHEPAKVEPKRLSIIQKIAKMTVGERIQMAMKGSRDERFILIRDSSKVVSSAVLQSPKITDQEVETFATMKNVQESVLRGIAMNRKFMKLYPVVRALASNPRCPMDVSLPLLKSLLITDLKNLSQNKNVADTVRKLALKLHRERTQERNKH